MGFDILLIATNANGMTIPPSAKCCICDGLLDDGVGLSGCDHNACYKCMKKAVDLGSKCPVDNQPFDVKKYYHLNDEIESWLSRVKLKCQWFDGRVCTATAISIRNAHRHRDICPNNPKNKLSKEQINTVKLVSNWMQNKEFNNDSADKSDDGSDSGDDFDGPSNGSHYETHTSRPTARSGFGYKPIKRSIGRRFFSHETTSDIDPNWRQ